MGLGGNDRINGWRDDDFTYGNSGNDDLGNYHGNDHTSGGGGDDLFNESAPYCNDFLDGGPGTDEASYEDEVIANLTTGSATGPEVGQDVLVGFENLDVGSGSAVFIGDSGPNMLRGGEYRDRLRGRGGDDVLSGDELADRLNGGPGFDTCAGEPTHDIIRNCEAGF